MYCSNCGTHNPETAKYCQSCGAALCGTPPVAPPLPPAGAAPVTSPVSTPTVAYAGFWRRFLAHIIDKMILIIPSWLIALLFGLGFITSLVDAAQSGCSDPEEIVPLILGSILSIFWLAIVIYLVQLFYFAGFESSKMQATPGKMALGIIVTDGQGRRVSFGRAIGRNLGKIISSAIFSIGYIMAGLTARKQALHDMLADCLVIMRPYGGI
ncbi:MAG: RDD family protein [Calditrichota bacterium]